MASILIANLPGATATSSSHWQIMRDDPYKQTRIPAPAPSRTSVPPKAERKTEKSDTK